MKPIDKRGQALGLQDMPQAFILLGIGVFAIVVVAALVQGLQDVSSVSASTCTAGGGNCTAAANISVQGLSAFTNAGTLFPILGLAVIAVVVIGVLFLIFRNR